MSGGIDEGPRTCERREVHGLHSSQVFAGTMIRIEKAGLRNTKTAARSLQSKLCAATCSKLDQTCCNICVPHIFNLGRKSRPGKDVANGNDHVHAGQSIDGFGMNVVGLGLL